MGRSVRRKIVEGGTIERTVIYNTGGICSLLEVVLKVLSKGAEYDTRSNLQKLLGSL